MESQIIDYYNELPHSVNVIDKMNEELSEIQGENEKLKEELKNLKMMFPNIPKFNITMITKEQLNDYRELFDTIKENLRRYLHSFKKEGVIADEEYDLKELFDKSYDLVDILFKGLNEYGSNLTISREWCEYRIDNALDKFKSIVELQKYWWENMIKDDICDSIIEMLLEYIIEGNDYENKLYKCVRITCDDCKCSCHVYGGDTIEDRKWICWDCFISETEFDE